MLAWLALASTSSDAAPPTSCEAESKLPESKVSAASPHEPAMPTVLLQGEPVQRPISETHEVDGRTVHMRELHEELQLTYVHGLLSVEEIATLLSLADGRQGFVRSPVKTQGEGADRAADVRRNSTSCPLLWPLVYGTEEMRSKLRAQPALIEELELVERLLRRISDLFTAAGMELTPQQIEPLQLVRYRDQSLFGPHHDYHEPGADGSYASSVQGEQRAFTLLVFGSTNEKGTGGETHFPHLQLKVSPRAGDAVAWANVDAEGAPNPLSLHEGLPPAPGEEKVVINVWIADRYFSPDELSKAYRTG
mmetsp:Transcript_13407/g.31633  ORF Transcript_13407/g.31633 Transcript_13407/m.31633 type:complete len:307 (-) Transcript_13407:74-994(-)